MRNYRFFLVFVSTTVLLIIYMLVVTISRVVLRVAVQGDGSVPKALEIVASGELAVQAAGWLSWVGAGGRE